MVVLLSNIIKGVSKRLSKKGSNRTFPILSWLQEKILKHQEDIKEKTLSIGKLQIVYRRPYEVLHTYKELFEDEIYRFRSTSDTPLIVDCGAHIGMSVLYFKSLFPKATVWAFEPDEENAAFLRKNIEINRLNEVSLYQSAIWNRDEVLYFKSSGSQGSQIAINCNQSNLIEVSAVRLASILEHTKVDFLKIDIEGAEYEVIKDCANSLHNVEHMFLEYHGKVSETYKLNEILQILEKNEFSVYIKMAADNLRHPYINKSGDQAHDVQLNIFCYRN